MTKENIYSEIESKCKLALIEAGETSIELKKNLKVNYKSQNQPVTNADLKINTFLKNFLKKITPNFGWLSEESKDDMSRLKCENFWCLDPIDGTRSYIHDKPEYTISLALINKKVPILGFIYNPTTKEFFFFKKKFWFFFVTKKKLSLTKKKKVGKMFSCNK